MKAFQSFNKESRFSDFCKSVKHCTLCPRLRDRKKVLSKSNGEINSRVLFVAEAPGRLGADKTGIPLFGDKTGDNFEALLGNIGWRREDIFITNAILCNPREEKGTNGTPMAVEIENCSPYLEMVINLVRPDVIVTLGSIALKSLEYIHAHCYILKQQVGQPLPWAGRIVVPLYHPGPRARVHRSFPKQTSDFLGLAKIVNPREGLLGTRPHKLTKRKKGLEDYSPDFQKVVYAVVQSLGKITYFKLTKLLYLIDLNALYKLGRTLTGEIYLRQQEGPWPPALRKLIEHLKGNEVNLSFRQQMPIIEAGPSPRISVDFENDALEIIEDVLERYGHLNNAGIKIAAYRTPPMQYILKQEKRGRDMRRVAVIFKNKTALEHDQNDCEQFDN